MAGKIFAYAQRGGKLMKILRPSKTITLSKSFFIEQGKESGLLKWFHFPSLLERNFPLGDDYSHIIFISEASLRNATQKSFS
jgi:hypothetical protein